MRFETISTGDEIVRGRSVDTNAPWIARRAVEEGVLRAFHAAVGDDLEGLAVAFASAAERADFVVVSGGLGPTADDYTRRAAARAAGVDLVLVSELLEAIEQRFAERGIPMPESNRTQAYVPDGATPLPNPLGTAPGFRLDLHGCSLYFLSGVPREMEVMFDAHVLPALREARGEGVTGAYRSLSTYGRPEAFVDEALRDLFDTEGVSVGLTALYGTIRVTIQSAGPDAAERATAVEEEARRRLGGLVLEAPTLEESVVALLADRGLTLAAAESCTGGLVARLITDVPGASAPFRGGVVAYANGAKTDLLGVPPDLLAAHGAVSEPVARAMAEGARRALGADLAVATTGVAGPSGGSDEKPVGLVHVALASPKGTEARRILLPGDRESVRRFSANVALGMARRWILKL
jgi:nicotinamide-nucleotide amidase